MSLCDKCPSLNGTHQRLSGNNARELSVGLTGSFHRFFQSQTEPRSDT